MTTTAQIAQDAPSAGELSGPCPTKAIAAQRIQEQFGASDSLAAKITARQAKGQTQFRDEDDIVRGASNFIDDLAILCAQTDASVLATMQALKDRIERRMSEAAMILTTDTDECATLRGHEAPALPWTAVAGELGCGRNNAYERFTPGVRAAKAAARLAAKATR